MRAVLSNRFTNAGKYLSYAYDAIGKSCVYECTGGGPSVMITSHQTYELVRDVGCDEMCPTKIHLKDRES